MIVLNEKQYAQRCLKDFEIGENPYFTLSVLAKYYYYICGYKKKNIQHLLIDFFNKCNTDRLISNDELEAKTHKIVSNIHKQKLYEFSGVKITKSEMDIIKLLPNNVLKKLLFTMLCFAKYYNLKSINNNGWVNAETKEIFKCANIHCSVVKKDIHIGELWDLGLIEFPKRCDNTNYRITFINDNDAEEVFISDFRNLGYEYLLYCGKPFIRCAECGILIKPDRIGGKKYCSNCLSDNHTKKILCIDCGKVVVVPSNNKRTCRCSQCQELRTKQNKSNWKKWGGI